MLMNHIPKTLRGRLITLALGVAIVIGSALGGWQVTKAHSGTLSAHAPLPKSLAEANVREAGYAGAGVWALTEHKVEVATGGAWRNVTPPGVDPTMIRTAYFLDAQHGWVAVSGPDGQNGVVPLLVYRTSDGGASWEASTVDASILLADSARAAARFSFVDQQTGWLEADMASSSAFSLGNLYRTTDGGASWTPLRIPYGGAIVFTTPNDGVLAGGVEGNRVSITHDGGQTWSPVAIPGASGGTASGVVSAPAFWTANDGVLTVTTPGARGSAVAIEMTSDGGASWTVVATKDAGATESAGSAAITVDRTGSWLADLGPGSSLVRGRSASTTVIAAAGLPSADVGAVVGISSGPSAGSRLAVFRGGVCEGFKTDCHEFGALFASSDDGANWAQLAP